MSQKLLKRLLSEIYEAEQQDEQVSKNLAKEDALTLIAEFVKDVKKKFVKKADRTEILDAAKKTLEFFINEIDKDEMSEIPEPEFIPSEDETDLGSEESTSPDETEDFDF